MKTNLLIIFFFSLILSNNLVKAQDELLENKYVPSANSQASPHCVIYNDINNLLYVYTGQKIIFVNKTSGIITGSIAVGQTGYFNGWYSTIERTQKLAFDHNRNYIYCANEDDKLLVIDCNNINNPQIIHEFSSLDPLIGSFLYFNSALDRVYWVQNSVQLSGINRLALMNPTTMSIVNIYETSSGHQISDVMFCHTNQYLALSTSSTSMSSGYISLMNPLNLSVFDSYVLTDYNANKLLYIGESNRLYCLTTNNNNSILSAFLVNNNTNHLDYQSNYSIPNFPIYESESSCYVASQIHYAYFAGRAALGEYKLVIVDYTQQNTGSPIIAEETSPVADQVINGQNNRVYCSHYNLYKMYGSIIENSISVNGESNHLIAAGGDQVVLSNIEGNSIQSYSLSPTLIYNVHIGDAVLRGVLNPIRQKIYWIPNISESSESYLSIQRLSDNSITSIPIGPGIYDLAYHESSDKLIVSNHNYSESQLTMVNGQTDQIQVISSDQVNIIQPGENNYTYLGGANVLKFINMSNYNIGQVQNNTLTLPYQIIDFALLNDGNCVTLAVENNVFGCKLLKIDHNSNQIIGSHSYQIQPLEHFDGLFYNKVKNQVYLLSDFSISVIDPSNFNVISTIYPNSSIQKCHYSPRNDRLILMCQDNQKILFYNASTFEFFNQVQLPVADFIDGSSYNQSNDMLYLHHTKYDMNYYKNEIRLLSYRCSDFQQNDEIYLEQNTNKNEWPVTLTEQMVFDASGNKMYVPNEGLGNISIVQCSPDQLTLQPRTINWLSFPRLERQDNNPELNDPVLAQSVLVNIDPFPPYIHMTNLPPQKSVGLEEYIEYHTWTPHWTGSLIDIYSTRGYKLETSNSNISYLPMEGTQLDPAYPLTIYAGYQNWVGYYPTWSQDPFAALSDALDKLTMIKHHDWVCYKQSCAHMQPGQPEPTCWICSKTKPLKYADMLILECSEDVTFQWGGTASGAIIDLPKSKNYAYVEKPDYTPIFIELDTSDHPLEIGAFIADSCIGATVVEELDTMAMIRGYLPDDSIGIITFEKYYGNEKSASDRIDEYYVLNNRTNLKEKRAIDTRENKKYYQVSFKKEVNSSSWVNPLILDFNPNPCPDFCNIDYFIPFESDVTFELFDVYGRKINTFKTENEQAGNYSIQWGKLFKNRSTPGIYLIRISACGNAITKKAIITK
jgi:hypothetical protein